LIGERIILAKEPEAAGSEDVKRGEASLRVFTPLAGFSNHRLSGRGITG
jgi:hypothetical protein